MAESLSQSMKVHKVHNVESPMNIMLFFMDQSYFGVLGNKIIGVLNQYLIARVLFLLDVVFY